MVPMDERLSPALPTSRSPDIDLLVSAAQGEMTFDRSRSSNLLGPPVALLIGWLMWPSVPHALVIGFVQQETMVLIFVLNIAAMLGAFAFGYGQDRLGHKRALAITLVGWVVTCVIAALTTTKGGFWYAAAIAGVCMGSSQSAGRAMAGLLAPPTQLAEFYGLWTFATRLASILGPLSYGAIAWATGGNQRAAIASTALLFVLGLLLLWPVDMARGRARALQVGAVR